jgi:hypothetical protein
MACVKVTTIYDRDADQKVNALFVNSDRRVLKTVALGRGQERRGDL